MESALSLRTNRLILARDIDYEKCKRLMPVCPECSEPVHLRRKFTTTNTSYFAHPVLKGDSDDVCSLRVFGYWDQHHVTSGMWASRGQLIEKIELELISYFSDQFGSNKDAVIKCVKRLIHEYQEFAWIYTDLIEYLSEAAQADIFKKIRDETTLGNDEGRELAAHYNLAISCLRSNRLLKASQGLLWCSFVTAHTLSDIYKTDADPDAGVKCGEELVDFSLSPSKFRKLIAGKIRFPRNKNYVYYRHVAISQRLLIRLLAGWRYPASIKRRQFLALCDHPKLLHAAVQMKVEGTLRPPLFSSLEERNRWLSENTK